MNSDRIIADNKGISFECIVVCVTFFFILSGSVEVLFNDTITQVFRPILIAFLLLRLSRNGAYVFRAKSIAYIAAFYCVFILLLHDVKNADETHAGIAHALFLIMFATVSAAIWRKKEIKAILMVSFIACFVCACLLLYSNPITDFNVPNSGGLKLLGKHVNRNLYAYTFELGTVLGLIYLLYGKNIPKLLFVPVTGVIVYAMIYSQCRGAFFSAIIACVIIYVSWLGSYKRKRRGQLLGWLFFTLVLLVAAYFIILNSPASRILDSESTSGREDGINNAFQMFKDSNTFGKIFGNGYTYEKTHSEEIGAHLVYAVFLVAGGIIGVTLISLVLIHTGLRIKGGIPYGLFFVGFGRTFFEAMDYYVYIPLILALIIYNHHVFRSCRVEEYFSR